MNKKGVIFMEDNLKEVYFSPYCSKCQFKDVAEDKEPCFTCLENPVNVNSHRPVNYKEKHV